MHGSRQTGAISSFKRNKRGVSPLASTKYRVVAFGGRISALAHPPSRRGAEKIGLSAVTCTIRRRPLLSPRKAVRRMVLDLDCGNTARYATLRADAGATIRRRSRRTTRDQAQRGFLQRGASIWKLAFADGSAECVVQVDAYNAGAIEPAESPDGRFLAWARMNGFRDIWHVVVARKDELGRVFELTPSDTPAHAPTWTPCGRYLAFAACAPNDPGWCVYVVNLAEGTWCNTGLGRNPSFSPDGKTLVCDDGRDWSMRPFPPREAFVPMREEKYAVGEVAFSVGPIPAGATRRPLPRETDFGTGDFWVSLAVACDPAAKGVRLFADGVYRSHKSAFQLHVDNAIRYPGASLALRTAKGEWFGTGPAPISGNGRHVVTGVKREGWIALYVDGRECVRRPVMEGICALSGPVAVSFKAENGTIHGFACGRGWPAALARPTRAELFGKEVTP